MLSIIIPVLNEEKSIGKLLDDLKKCYIAIPYEIIVVDNGSEDSTRNVVLSEQEREGRLRLVSFNDCRGLGRSLKKGFESSRGDIIVMVMGDLSDNVKDIPLMLEKILQDKYDFVCASRYCQGGIAKHSNIFKGFCSRIFGKILHFFIKIPTLDPCNAYKMFKVEILKNVYPLESNYYTLGLELLLKSYQKGFKIIEIPTQWLDRENGKTHFVFLYHGFEYLKWLISTLFMK